MNEELSIKERIAGANLAKLTYRLTQLSPLDLAKLRKEPLPEPVDRDSVDGDSGPYALKAMIPSALMVDYLNDLMDAGLLLKPDSNIMTKKPGECYVVITGEESLKKAAKLGIATDQVSILYPDIAATKSAVERYT